MAGGHRRPKFFDGCFTFLIVALIIAIIVIAVLFSNGLDLSWINGDS